MEVEPLAQRTITAVTGDQGEIPAAPTPATAPADDTWHQDGRAPDRAGPCCVQCDDIFYFCTPIPLNGEGVPQSPNPLTAVPICCAARALQIRYFPHTDTL